MTAKEDIRSLKNDTDKDIQGLRNGTKRDEAEIIRPRLDAKIYINFSTSHSV